ncbi:type 1 fimbrial protein [Pseudomonas juntendi]|jgi:major type 1 subunit fimbrin (pilin)|uniref:Fimbrial protein n=1 Tax=Pseudomonas juntendi TaxID=2666183 RepID=A0ABD4Y9Z8_9PSED|nr:MULTISPECIES: fimbrial protein [Pseudomonas]EGC00344.1 type 1 pili subunit FimI [Pseudomonas sp. TJI-51]MBA6122962.1 type 1 fimbrial protein [Pseudomonas juntendi]MBH3376550.1 type 1 fimbrial protein [Pseudomonas juntendi]MBI6915288.1 type 1 fimbrial protein [Pseudomonas juntendi]MBS6038049.1 type 1 fimbrial protein [Pseudomonas sp.]
MKKKLIPLAILLGLASNAAFANTGSINFYGQVHAGTCPIELIDPSTGLPLSRINMGNVSVSQFAAIGDEAASRAFGMRVTPGNGCVVTPSTSAQVTFTAAYGGAGTGGALYALEPGGAADLALIIKDNAGTPINNGSPSKDYPLDDTNPTTMIFSAAYKSIGTGVTAGTANTDVQFLVDIP